MASSVTKVNLPDRTKARFEAEANQQRVQKPHDIRSSIPLVDYTNPAKFPPYVYREYPKMPLLDGNRPIVIDESGGVLIFYDATDEVDFKDMNPEIAEEIERNTPARALADAMAAKDAQIEDMRARLRAAGLTDEDEKPVNALRGVARGKLPESGKPVSEASDSADDPKPEGLRSTLPPNGNPLKKGKH